MTRCEKHPAYEADYCPVCGTTILVGERMTTLDQAAEEFYEDVVERVATACRQLVLLGVAEWVWDPEAVDVVGLVLTGTRRALVIVYLASTRALVPRLSMDWEADEPAVIAALAAVVS